MKSIISLLLCLIASFSQAAVDNSVMKVKVNKGDFVVHFPSNPTTGYRWSLMTYNKALLKLTCSKYIVPQTNRIGAGGTTKFCFHLRNGQALPKQTTLHFKYARPWEAQGGRVKTVIVYFTRA